MTDKRKDEIKLTRKQMGVLRSADRKCGMSYRSVCGRGVQDTAIGLVKNNLLYLHDTGRMLGRFIYRTTDMGKAQLK